MKAKPISRQSASPGSLAPEVQAGQSSPAGQGESGEVGLADGLPAGWVNAVIEDFAKTATGGTPSRKRDDYYGGDIPWVKSGDLTDGLVSEVDEKITQLGLNESNAKMFPKGAVCIALYGATVGKLGVLDMDASTNQAVCGIFAEEDISPDFVFHSLKNERTNLIAKAQGGAQPNISNGIIKKTVLRVAPKAEQLRIVSAIESLQERSSRAKQALCEVGPLLSQLRQSVLRGAFSGRLTARWRTENRGAEPASELLARIRTERRERWEAAQLAKYEAKGKQPPKNWQDKYKEPEPVDESTFSDLPDLPEGWLWTNMDTVSHRVSVGHVGATSKFYCEADEGIPFLRSQNVRPRRLSEKGLNYIVPDFHNKLQKSQLQEGDILVVRVGANRGDTCRVPAGYDKLNCANIVFARPCGQLSEFIELFCQSNLGQSLLLGMSRGGAQGVINTTSIAELPIPVCSYEEQAEIIRRADEAFDSTKHVETVLATSEAELTQLDQSIIAKAFRGELVPQDSGDEPASQLLHRIRTTREKLEAAEKEKKKAAKAKKKATKKPAPKRNAGTANKSSKG